MMMIVKILLELDQLSNPKGAVGCVGISTTGTHTAYNNILNMGIYEGIYSNGVTYAGSATTSGRLAIYRTYPQILEIVLVRLVHGQI